VNTEDLINLISEDTRRPVNLSRGLALATAAGALVAGLVFFSVLGVRPDFAQAILTARFAFKFIATLALFFVAASLMESLIRPGESATARRWLLLLAPALLIAAVVVELIVTPADLWESRLVGQNALHCLTVIPILSLAPTMFLFLVMRHGAPDHPGQAGAIAALASAGIAATLYASNCPDDSPLFVATWYPIAILIVAVAGYFAGRRFLRW
jgi:hypothetical protein